MCHNISNSVFVVTNGFRAAVKVTGTIVLPVEVFLSFQGVIAVERDDELDAIASRSVHEVIESIEDFIVPGLGSVALEIGKAVYGCALLWRCLTYNMSGLSCLPLLLGCDRDE
jgi:hypothetical protein